MSRFMRVVGLLGCVALAGCGEEWGVDQHGQPVTAAQLEGQWLVINYWAEWCGPCRTEIPELNAMAASPDGPVVLGVNFDGLQGEELAQASQALGIEFRVLAEDPAERLQLSRSAVLPVTYLVDGEGKVRQQLVGEQTAEGLEAQLAQLGREGSGQSID
ncbi:TlpA family protein disulfide reductase [Stutzerimonas nitrititolerans]|uniref:TlpA family protein disulfide reductase n=1 Tax=Stutzerimonas nitrititolerans TaxID=2482751 RepID=UPI0028A9FDC4|nr:TlpA disulfide reductase family protein [Stutzerimonas nitrititolerans]